MPARLIYAALPIALFLTFQIASHVHGQTGGIIAFGLAGLACSAFLPLSISFGGKEYPELSAVMAGGLIAFYQLGYGVAAFGIGPLHDPAGVALATIFAAGSLVAVPLVLIAYFITRRRG
jgi:MFS transporter, FHS family, glucose/mannose:H+ symporter